MSFTFMSIPGLDIQLFDKVSSAHKLDAKNWMPILLHFNGKNSNNINSNKLLEPNNRKRAVLCILSLNLVSKQYVPMDSLCQIAT